jgi:hypothetical protein
MRMTRLWSTQLFERIEGNPMIKRSCFFALVVGLLSVGIASAQEFPVMDMVADTVIQRYQTASCEELWVRKGEPKSEKEMEALQLLRDNPQMRTAFINKVAGTIVNKMFECGMIP